jgi:hypothetical protein
MVYIYIIHIFIKNSTQKMLMYIPSSTNVLGPDAEKKRRGKLPIQTAKSKRLEVAIFASAAVVSLQLQSSVKDKGKAVLARQDFFTFLPSTIDNRS